MIEKINSIYVECDNCGDVQDFSHIKAIAKKDIFKRYIIYEDSLNGEQSHFCCEKCARAYLKAKGKELSMRKITKLKDFDMKDNSVESNKF